MELVISYFAGLSTLFVGEIIKDSIRRNEQQTEFLRDNLMELQDAISSMSDGIANYCAFLVAKREQRFVSDVHEQQSQVEIMASILAAKKTTSKLRIRLQDSEIRSLILALEGFALKTIGDIGEDVDDSRILQELTRHTTMLERRIEELLDSSYDRTAILKVPNAVSRKINNIRS